MINALVRWAILTIAVWVASAVHAVSYDDWQSLLVAALILGILNAFVKPLLSLVTIPLVILTFGVFLIIINATLLWLTSRLVPGFHVSGFWAAVGGSLVISIISVFLGYPRGRRRVVITRPGPPPAADQRPPPPGKGRIIDV